MNQVAASDHGQAIRQHVLAALDPRPGQVALDVGCGPGTNLGDLAVGVTSTGRVIGVDTDPAMVQAARTRMAEQPAVEVRLGDAHALPVDDGAVDRVRVDRVLQHVTSPAEVIAELRRVSRPGAVVSLAEPDWATLAIDADDLRTATDFTRYTCAKVVRNASVGRQLARLAAAAGFTVRSVHAMTPLFTDFEETDQILGLTRNSVRAVAAGYIDSDRAEDWLSALRSTPFLATFVFFTVVAEAAA
jgi:ubiquinone/menaquinone biosynthesis C-methylase UbiE